MGTAVGALTKLKKFFCKGKSALREELSGMVAIQTIKNLNLKYLKLTKFINVKKDVVEMFKKIDEECGVFDHANIMQDVEAGNKNFEKILGSCRKHILELDDIVKEYYSGGMTHKGFIRCLRNSYDLIGQHIHEAMNQLTAIIDHLRNTKKALEAQI